MPRTFVAQRSIGPAAIFLTKLPAEITPLLRRHLSPLFPHLLPPFGRQRPKPLAGIADSLPLFRRELTKALETLTETLLLIWRQLLPLLEALTRLVAFLRVHVPPLARSVQQPLLSVRRQLIPIPAKSLEEFLFVLTKLAPRNPGDIGLSTHGSDHGQEDDHKCHHGLHGVTSLRGSWEAGSFWFVEGIESIRLVPGRSRKSFGAGVGAGSLVSTTDRSSS